jgi:hypothetical protein
MSAYETQKNASETSAFKSGEKPHWTQAVKWKDLVAVSRVEVVSGNSRAASMRSRRNYN